MSEIITRYLEHLVHGRETAKSPNWGLAVLGIRT